MALQPDWQRKVGELTEKQKLQFSFSSQKQIFGSLRYKSSQRAGKITQLHSTPIQPPAKSGSLGLDLLCNAFQTDQKRWESLKKKN